MFNKNGFTLIELMIVVVIIGVFAAIFIPSFVAMQDRVREASVKSNGHTVQLAVEDYAVQNNGVYPYSNLAWAQIVANLPGGEVVRNPFSGEKGLTVGVGAAEGMVDYTLPVDGVYIITCYGESGVNILTLTNG